MTSVVGCGPSGPPLADVNGTVTLNGQPLAGALVEFQPDSTEGSPSYGETDAEGKYRLVFTQQRSGAWIGNHTVAISTLNENERVPEKVPPEFNVETTLQREVVAGEMNVIDFALETQ